MRPRRGHDESSAAHGRCLHNDGRRRCWSGCRCLTRWWRGGLRCGGGCRCGCGSRAGRLSLSWCGSGRCCGRRSWCWRRRARGSRSDSRSRSGCRRRGERRFSRRSHLVGWRRGCTCPDRVVCRDRECVGCVIGQAGYHGGRARCRPVRRPWTHRRSGVRLPVRHRATVRQSKRRIHGYKGQNPGHGKAAQHG